MAFFDDFGKKLSQAGQTAVQKTKDMTDVARLNGAISEQEKKQLETYLEIGKLYVSKYGENCDSDFSVMIASIMDSENKIREFRQQIQDIKGVVKCEKCGAEVANNAAFCSSCGAKMQMPVKPGEDTSTKKCTSCGATVKNGAKFCTTCGNTIPAHAEEPAHPSESEQLSNSGDDNVTELAEENSNKIFCTFCGSEMGKNMMFCTKCGNKKE